MTHLWICVTLFNKHPAIPPVNMNKEVIIQIHDVIVGHVSIIGIAFDIIGYIDYDSATKFKLWSNFRKKIQYVRQVFMYSECVHTPHPGKNGIE